MKKLSSASATPRLRAASVAILAVASAFVPFACGDGGDGNPVP